MRPGLRQSRVFLMRARDAAADGHRQPRSDHHPQPPHARRSHEAVFTILRPARPWRVLRSENAQHIGDQRVADDVLIG